MYKGIAKLSDKKALTVPDSRSVAPYASQATPASDTQPAPLDLLMNAWLGKLTLNVSPAEMTNAFGDWLMQLQRVAATEVTFLLITGGHNAGVVSPPGQRHRSYQVSRHANGDLYIDPDAWQSTVTHRDGSRWPEWEHWLATHAGKRKKAPAIQHEICAAPGSYVMQK